VHRGLAGRRRRASREYRWLQVRHEFQGVGPQAARCADRVRRVAGGACPGRPAGRWAWPGWSRRPAPSGRWPDLVRGVNDTAQFPPARAGTVRGTVPGGTGPGS